MTPPAAVRTQARHVLLAAVAAAALAVAASAPQLHPRNMASARVCVVDRRSASLRDGQAAVAAAGPSLQADAVRVAASVAREVNSRLAVPDVVRGWRESGNCAGGGTHHLGAGEAPRVVVLLQGAGAGGWGSSPCGGVAPATGSFLLHALDGGGGAVVLAAGDADGLRAGSGRLLRELRMPARVRYR